MIEGDVDEPTERPWWFVPALSGVLVGALIGAALVPSPRPPCSLPGTTSELVVRRFFERFGSSGEAIAECWTVGRLSAEERRAYVDARPPTTIAIVHVSEGPAPGVTVVGPNEGIYERWELALVWAGSPPRGWARDQSRVIGLVGHDAPIRWTIQFTDAPPRTALDPRLHPDSE